MAVVDVINVKGEKISELDLADDIFNVAVKSSVLHEVVTMQLAKRRSGTASVKRRSDVKGSTRKLYRQKGTGRARRGDVKSPLLRGGGVVFGPNPRSYDYSVPKKVKKLALKMALSSKLQENALTVLDKLELEGIKTKEFARILESLGKKNMLLITNEKDRVIELSARNLPGVKILRSEGLNVYDILKYQDVVLLEAAVEGIQGRLSA